MAPNTCVAVIPARGGSKGIPRKNLRTVGGMSLLGRAIATCLRAQSVSEVYVSTEDQEIAETAAAWRASVIQRPWRLAADEASSCDVLLHALGQIEPQPAILAFVQCTAPLLKTADVDGCVERLRCTKADVAIAAAEFHGFILRESYHGRVRGVGWELTDGPKRRQDLPAQWVIAGSVWAIDVARFLQRRTIYSENCVVYPICEKLDIDGPEDLRLAEVLLRLPADEAEATRAETPSASQPQVYYPL